MSAADPRIEILPDAMALTRYAAERFVATAAQAVTTSGRFRVALSGGSTPEGLYRLLAQDEYAARVDWTRTHLFWGDERCVPPGDPASNYRMVREAMIDRVVLPPENVHRIHGESEPPAAAAAYERSLRAAFRAPVGPPPTSLGARFDLVLLGLGTDGHTASLFPGHAAVRETERWVVAEYVRTVSMDRVTLTPPAINAAAEIWFMVSGAEKADTLRRVLSDPLDPVAIPAQAIAPCRGRLRWLLDETAGTGAPRA